MSAYIAAKWNSNSRAIAAAIPFDAAYQDEPMREKLAAVRDTLIVLGLQMVFRAAMLLRRWNY